MCSIVNVCIYDCNFNYLVVHVPITNIVLNLNSQKIMGTVGVFILYCTHSHHWRNGLHSTLVINKQNNIVLQSMYLLQCLYKYRHVECIVWYWTQYKLFEGQLSWGGVLNLQHLATVLSIWFKHQIVCFLVIKVNK